VIDLFAAGWGEGWWRVRGAFWVSDGRRLWAPGRPARVWRVEGVHQVLADDAGLRVLAASEHRPDPAGVLRPVGPGRAVYGGAESWVADGYVYHRSGGVTRAVDRSGPGERTWIGGGGVVVVEGPDGVRVGLPGRTPTLLAAEAAGLRLAEDGAAVAFVGPEGAERVALSGGARTTLVGLPVTDRLQWRDGALWSGRVRFGSVVQEASAARLGHLLAGPAGRVWDLVAARAVTAPGTVLPGATAVVGDGFVTVDGETGRGHFVGPGGVRDPFVLPLDPDDVVAGIVVADGAAWAVTALGEGFRWTGAGWSPGNAPRIPRPRPAELETPAGPFADAAQWRSPDGSTWVWNHGGWLVRFVA
jgi:hypothetical protein